MTEVWKDIAGYEGLYMVSTLGNVKSLNYRRTGKEMILIQGLTKDGYLYVVLCKNGKVRNYTIHRLVAEAFIPNPFKLPCVNHKGSKTDNRVEMLEWCSYSYNNTYNNRHLKIGEKISIPVYCIEFDKVFSSAKEAERITGISKSNICSCFKGRRKTAGGYHWRYANQ